MGVAALGAVLRLAGGDRRAGHLAAWGGAAGLVGAGALLGGDGSNPSLRDVLEIIHPNFGEPPKGEVRRIPLLRGWVNMAREGRSLSTPALFLFALSLAGGRQIWGIERRPWSGANNTLWSVRQALLTISGQHFGRLSSKWEGLQIVRPYGGVLVLRNS